MSVQVCLILYFEVLYSISIFHPFWAGAFSTSITSRCPWCDGSPSCWTLWPSSSTPRTGGSWTSESWRTLSISMPRKRARTWLSKVWILDHHSQELFRIGLWKSIPFQNWAFSMLTHPVCSLPNSRPRQSWPTIRDSPFLRPRYTLHTDIIISQNSVRDAVTGD